jgi:hypothetical protein
LKKKFSVLDRQMCGIPLMPFGCYSPVTQTFCKYCGRPFHPLDTYPHRCPDIWLQTWKSIVSDAVRLLESEGFTIQPPVPNRWEDHDPC